MAEMGIGGFTSLLDDSFIFNKLTEKEYPDFVTRTIRILGANSGLRLIFANKLTESKFDSKERVVFIPPPPYFPKKGNKKVMDAFFQDLSEWRGALNHEVGHARFSLWRARKKDNRELKNYEKKYHEFVDLFENGRMERVVCEEYPGMLPDLQSLEGVLRRAILELQKKDPKNFRHLYYAMRMAVNGYPIVIEIPKKLQKDFEKCMEFVQAAQETNSEEETVEIAKEVYKYFKNRKKEEKKKEKAKKEKREKEERDGKDKTETNEEEGEGEDQDGKNEENTEDDTEERGASSDNGENEEEDNEKEGDEIDEKEDNEKDNEEEREKDDGSGDKGESAENEQEEEINKKENGQGEETEDKNEDDIDIGSASFNTKGIEIIDPLKTFVSEQEFLEEHISKGFYYKTRKRYEDVIPMPLDDYVENINIKSKKNAYETNKILNETIGSICGMAQRFIQKVRASRHVGRRTYQGRLSSRSLHKFRTSKNIFKTENMRKKKGASVMIIVDCSGSMFPFKIKTALQSALVMGEIMNQAKVEFEVIGFTTSTKTANFKAFTRTNYLKHFRFGSNKDWNNCKYKLVEANEHIQMRDNDDGESLRQFASEIAKSKKERKMMIVISDGEPSSCAQRGDEKKDLHRAIKEIRESGTDIYAVGLSTNVERFYGKENSVNISARCSTEDLVLAMSKFINLIETY